VELKAEIALLVEFYNYKNLFENNLTEMRLKLEKSLWKYNNYHLVEERLTCSELRQLIKIDCLREVEIRFIGIFYVCFSEETLQRLKHQRLTIPQLENVNYL
jgi:hypothetical protein